MHNFIGILLFSLMSYTSLVPYNEGGWKLEKNKNGILVYTQMVENEEIKQIRMITTADAKLSTAIAVLTDVSNYKQWIYKCVYSKLVKQVSDHEMIYYSITDGPWPVIDRDLVLLNKIHQHPETKIVYSVTETKLDYIPEKEDYVRIKNMKGVWKFTPLKDGKIAIEYYLQVDPAGKLPPWVVNMFITTGPYQTMEKFKEMLGKDGYKGTTFDFIEDH